MQHVVFAKVTPVVAVFAKVATTMPKLEYFRDGKYDRASFLIFFKIGCSFNDNENKGCFFILAHFYLYFFGIMI